MNLLLNVRIIESALMVEDGEPFEVKRTWRERLLSMPWRPFLATRTVVPKVPKRDVISMADGSLVMHPYMAAELRRSMTKSK